MNQFAFEQSKSIYIVEKKAFFANYLEKTCIISTFSYITLEKGWYNYQ